MLKKEFIVPQGRVESGDAAELMGVGPKGAIIVVDDEDSWRQNMVEQVRTVFGDDVGIVEAADYKTAKDLLEQESGRLIGLVTDISYLNKPEHEVPGVRQDKYGLRLMKDVAKGTIKGVDPDLPMVITSGGYYDKEPPQVKGNSVFVNKIAFHPEGNPEPLRRIFEEKFRPRLKQ